jgi:hypothetical protein
MEFFFKIFSAPGPNFRSSSSINVINWNGGSGHISNQKLPQLTAEEKIITCKLNFCLTYYYTNCGRSRFKARNWIISHERRKREHELREKFQTCQFWTPGNQPPQNSKDKIKKHSLNLSTKHKKHEQRNPKISGVFNL